MRPRTDRTALVRRTGLVVGFVAVTVAALSAHTAPADGYEPSLYAATPMVFWLAVAVAFGSGLLGALFPAGDRTVYVLSLVLAGVSFLLVVGLPLVRAYEFYGAADSLSHLGWARQGLTGRLELASLLYPALHGVTILVAKTTGSPLTQGMGLAVLAYVLAFAVFVPLVVRSLVDRSRAVALATISGFLLLPVNKVSAYLTGHPTTMATLFTPVVVYLLVRYLREPADHSGWVSPVGGLLALSALAITLVHPQQALNLLLVFFVVATFQFGRRTFADDPRDPLNTVYAQTAFLAVVFVAWSLPHERVSDTVSGYVAALLSSPSGSAIAQRGASLGAIGVSFGEVYVKLFLVSTVYLLASAVLVVVALSRRPDRWSLDHSLPTLLGLGLVPVGLVFLVYLAASIGTMYFRQLGFIMAVATVLGAIAFHRQFDVVERMNGPVVSRLLTGGTVLGIAAMVVLSGLVLFPSPYIYQPNLQVTEMQFQGYEHSFDQAAGEYTIRGVRDGPDRFRDAIEGTGELDSSAFRDATGLSGEAMAGDLASADAGPYYLVVTDLDRGREVAAFRELRYDAETLDRVGARPGVDRVRANGGFELYLVQGNATAG